MNKTIFILALSLIIYSCSEQKIPLPTDPKFGLEAAFYLCKMDNFMNGYQDSLFPKSLQNDETYEDIVNRKYLELPYGDRSKKLFKYFLGIDDSINYLPSMSYYGANSFFNNDRKVEDISLQDDLGTKLYWNYQHETPKDKACITVIEVKYREDSLPTSLSKHPTPDNRIHIIFPCDKRKIDLSIGLGRGVNEKYGEKKSSPTFAEDELNEVFTYAKKKYIGKITSYINLINDLDAKGWSTELIESSKDFRELRQGYSGYHIGEIERLTWGYNDYTAVQVGDWLRHYSFPYNPLEKKRHSHLPSISLEQQRHTVTLFLMDTVPRPVDPPIPVTIEVMIKHAKLIPSKPEKHIH